MRRTILHTCTQHTHVRARIHYTEVWSMMVPGKKPARNKTEGEKVEMTKRCTVVSQGLVSETGGKINKRTQMPHWKGTSRALYQMCSFPGCFYNVSGASTYQTHKHFRPIRNLVVWNWDLLYWGVFGNNLQMILLSVFSCGWLIRSLFLEIHHNL